MPHQEIKQLAAVTPLPVTPQRVMRPHLLQYLRVQHLPLHHHLQQVRNTKLKPEKRSTKKKGHLLEVSQVSKASSKLFFVDHETLSF
jgi:hypothetical protein